MIPFPSPATCSERLRSNFLTCSQNHYVSVPCSKVFQLPGVGALQGFCPPQYLVQPMSVKLLAAFSGLFFQAAGFPN